MKYLPHAAAFTFFMIVGLACLGFVAPLNILRALVALVCLICAIGVIEAAIQQHRETPHVESEAVTFVTVENLPAGTVCSVDPVHGTIERAPS